MHALLCSAEISEFCYWLKQLFSSWSSQHGEWYCPFSCAWIIRYLCISISYLCNINVMNARNNEIFYAESVHNLSESLLLLSTGHYVEVFQHFHSPLSLHPCQPQHHFSNCPKPFPKLSLFRKSSLCLWQAGASKGSSAVWAAFAGCCQQTQRWIS